MRPFTRLNSMAFPFSRAAKLIAQADGLLITAGAGMGIDSGLPDFRSAEGFWNAYPALGRAKIQFEAIANPDAFHILPEVAWGFYGHRLNLYRNTVPHEGFGLLLRMAEGMEQGAFVLTSNVDGQFQKAGFSEAQVCEVHGSIHHLQCMEPCHKLSWSAAGFVPEVDEENCKLRNEPPWCPRCSEMARPNVLMLGDWSWVPDRQQQQERRLQAWLDRCKSPLLIEVGAGTAIPTLRRFADRLGVPLIRINPHPEEAGVALPRDVSIPLGALEGLHGIADALGVR
jgi:NAD-dependent SIR2 family protein deacetylase